MKEKSIKVKLVAGPGGQPRLETSDSQVISNLFVQSCKKVEGQFAMELKVIGQSNILCGEGKSW